MTTFATLPSSYRDGKYTPSATTSEVVHTETLTTDFYNLKNKAAGARRYGYRNTVIKYSNPDGAVAYRFDLQTTLNGERYQSSKYGKFEATEAAAKAALAKAVQGAAKRYAKLAAKAGSGVEHRPA